jgi:hypothetical protein
MRTLVAALVAGLVLASCERPSGDGTAEAEAPKKTARSFVAGSRLLKTEKAVPGRYIIVLDEKAMGPAQVVFYDGATGIGTDTTAPYSVSWNLLSVPKGWHTLTAKAYDPAGNVTTSAPIAVKVN